MLIAITRLKEKSTDDKARCRKYGHRCIAVSPLEARINHEEVSRFAGDVNSDAYDCIFFTSALPARLIGPLLTRWPRVVAIGPQTARELAKYGIAAEILDSFYSSDFARHLGTWIEGKHIGIPRADVPNHGLMASIEGAGGSVTEVRCYSLVPTRTPLPLGDAGALLFTSAMSYRQAVWETTPGLLLVAIGEVTAAAMRDGGHPPAVVGDGSLEGTLQALNRSLEETARGQQAGNL